MDTVKADCIVCSKQFDFDPKMCCSGRECGCMGLPTEPQVCSAECFDTAYPPYNFNEEEILAAADSLDQEEIEKYAKLENLILGNKNES